MYYFTGLFLPNKPVYVGLPKFGSVRFLALFARTANQNLYLHGRTGLNQNRTSKFGSERFGSGSEPGSNRFSEQAVKFLIFRAFKYLYREMHVFRAR
jgi:hypothetical protein